MPIRSFDIFDTNATMSYLPVYFIFVVGLCIYAIHLWNIPILIYITDLNVDDSFYYFLISRNFANSVFSSSDGVGMTNGYHPLWAWVLVPLFYLFDDPVFILRTIKVLEILLVALGTLLLMKSTRYSGWSWILIFIIPIWFLATKLFYVGLETSPQILLFSLLILSLVKIIDDQSGCHYWGILCVVAALLPWTRLETLAIAVTLSMLLTFYAAFQAQLFRKWKLGILTLWLSIFLSLSLYFVYNHIIFGTPVPVSGQVKSFWSEIRFTSEPFNLIVIAQGVG